MTVTDYISATAIFISACALGVVAWQAIKQAEQVDLMKKQIKDEKKFKTQQLAITFFPNTKEFQQIKSDANKLLYYYEYNPNNLDKVFDDKDLPEYKELKILFNVKEDFDVTDKLGHLDEYLNEIEKFCTAINLGIIDFNTAAKLYKQILLKLHEKSGKIIKKYREKPGNNLAFIEFEMVVRKLEIIDISKID